MQKHLFLTVLLLSVSFVSRFEAHAQDPPAPQQSNEPAKIELGVHFSSLQIGPSIDAFGDFQDR